MSLTTPPEPVPAHPAQPEPASDAAPPLREGRYRLIEVMGEGGMATVYRGVDTRLRVARAIKILLPQLAARPKLRGRFEDEARTMARLTHPHIVAVQDVDIEGDRVFLVMDLLEGGTLWEWVHRHGPMPPRLAVDATLPVLDALAFAHRAGVVHRDVKPQNVLLTRDGVPRLTDFGIARIDAEGSGTRTAAVMGTWTYMPPEQRRSAKEVDLRADLYAVGAMLFALVRGEDPPDLFAADLDASLLDGIPEPLAAVIRSATRYQREERFVDAVAMGQALLACRSLLPEVPESLQAMLPATMGAGLSLTGQLHSMKGAASSLPPATDRLTLPPAPLPRPPAAETMVPLAGETFADEALDEALDEPPDEPPAGRLDEPPPAPPGRGRAPLVALVALLSAGALASALWWALPQGEAGSGARPEDPSAQVPAEVSPSGPVAASSPSEAPPVPAVEASPPPTDPSPPPGAAPTAQTGAPPPATPRPTEPAPAPAEPAPPEPAPAEPAPAEPAPAEPAAEEPVADAAVTAAASSPAQPAPAEPAPAEPEPAAPSGPPGRVSVLGPISKATLIDKSSSRRVSPGEVPVGEYWLEVRFNGSSEDLRVGSVRVISGFSLTLNCNGRSKTCH